jgi:hypothetical protein
MGCAGLPRCDGLAEIPAHFPVNKRQLAVVSAVAILSFGLGAWVGSRDTTTGTRSNPSFAFDTVPRFAGTVPERRPSSDAFAEIVSNYKDPDVLRRSYNLDQILGSKSTAELAAMLDKAFHLSQKDSESIAPLIFGRLCQKDPVLATNLLKERPLWFKFRPDIAYVGSDRNDLLEAWARNAPEQVLAVLVERPNSFGVVRAVEYLVDLHGTDPSEQITYAEQLPSGPARTQAISRVIAKWADRDPIQALRAADSLSTEGEREIAVKSCLSKWVTRDPDSGLSEVAARADALPVGPWGNSFINDISSTVAQHDPIKAADWALTLPEGQRQAAATSVLYQWMGKDLGAAFYWAVANGVQIDIGPPSLDEEYYRYCIPVGMAASNQTEQLVAWLQTLPDADREKYTSCALQIVAKRAREKLEKALQISAQ